MGLTREQAIENHKKMWNWISDKTMERKRIVYEWEYFGENKVHDIPIGFNYGCEYDRYHNSDCKNCILKFIEKNKENIQMNTTPCCNPEHPHSKWVLCFENNDYINASKYAKKIAEFIE